ncbi:MAG TPA: YXWGXW repeat-containing protein [Polyangiaceae bacterium]|nr:YXWGXW repeat-containing protein [Polyangiaceae bacterium]
MEVPFPPPPARVEFIPDKPRSGAVWVDGEWSWTGRRWAWNYGKWVVPPETATFSPWRTVRSDDGTLLFVAGIWHDAKGTEIPDPQPLVVGRAREENVILPPGQPEKTAPNQVPGKTTPNP